MRPTKYEERFVDELIEFFSASSIDYEGGEVGYRATKFPTLARFACNIGVHRETLINWANAKDDEGNLKNPSFFDAYKRAKEYQEAYIYEGAMVNAVNPTFAIWTAKAVLGHRDSDANQDEDSKPLTINIGVQDARK